jgi:RNA polymerase primary sigma factor
VGEPSYGLFNALEDDRAMLQLLSITEPTNNDAEFQQQQSPQLRVVQKSAGQGRPALRDGISDSALSRYLRDIGEVELLTAEQEIELAGRIHAGDPAAREHMIKANLRLVVKYARDYEGLGVPVLDLISEGNIGLMKAVDRFDPTKGARFCTYATFWIKQQIRRALTDQSKTIRLPAHALIKVRRMREAERELFEELGREPHDDELSEALGMEECDVAELRRAACRPASLEAPAVGFEGGTLADVMEDESAENPAKRSAENGEVGMLRHLVTKLPAREAKILRARFGLDDGSQQTLEEISERYGVTRERIRQIQDSALRRLRGMCRKLQRYHERSGLIGSFAE